MTGEVEERQVITFTAGKERLDRLREASVVGLVVAIVVMPLALLLAEPLLVVVPVAELLDVWLVLPVSVPVALDSEPLPSTISPLHPASNSATTPPTSPPVPTLFFAM